MVTYKGYRGKSALELMAKERAQGVLYESGRINPYGATAFPTRATPAMYKAAIPKPVVVPVQVRTAEIIASITRHSPPVRSAPRRGGVLAKPLSIIQRPPPTRGHPGSRALPPTTINKPKTPPVREVRPPGKRALPLPPPQVPLIPPIAILPKIPKAPFFPTRSTPLPRKAGGWPRKPAGNPVGGALMAFALGAAAIASMGRSR